MSALCTSCGQDIKTKKETMYTTNVLGIPVSLFNSVTITSCGCDGQDEETNIPNIKGLMAAAAVSRVMMPEKLIGVELKFLRKAAGLNAKNLADLLSVTPETISRWENDKTPITVASEKLLRMFVAVCLKDDAPAIDCELKDIGKIEISGFAQPGNPVHMTFALVRFKAQNKSPGDEYAVEPIAA